MHTHRRTTRIAFSAAIFATSNAFTITTNPALPPTALLRSTTAGHEGVNATTECPFSRAFPRFRVGLTYFQEAGEAPKSKKSEKEPFNGFFPKLPKLPTVDISMPGAKMQKRSKMEQRLKRELDDRSSYESVEWMNEMDGVPAFSKLWNQAADLLESSKPPVKILAFPDASRRMLVNWMEIVDWMNDHQRQSGYDGPRLQIKLLGGNVDDKDQLPFAVQLSVEGSKEENTSQFATPYSEEDLTKATKSWVKRILVQQGICPFTKSAKSSGHGLADMGIPVGNIAYHSSFASAHKLARLQADTWSAIDAMLAAGPDGKTGGVSSILLAAPAFNDDLEEWAGPVFAMLEAGVVAANALADVGVVCFHPKYATPDGASWPGFGHMHSVPRLEGWYRETKEARKEDVSLTKSDIAAGGAWQRRTPHATINVLRADQLEAAESRRSSGTMYTENIDRLMLGIGSDRLSADLKREQRIGTTPPLEP